MIRRKSQRLIAAIRAELRAADPRCHWCACETLEHGPGRAHHPDVATIDHLKSRLQCKSHDEYHAQENLVLACLECNQTRDRIFLKTEHVPRAKEKARIERERVTGPHIEHILKPSAIDQLIA